MPLEWTDSFHEWKQEYRIEDDGTVHMRRTMDALPILESAKAAHNSGAGSSPSGDLKWVGSIPMGLWLKWKMEDGVDILQRGSEEFLKRKLNDPEFAYLRVWTGRIGDYGR